MRTKLFIFLVLMIGISGIMAFKLAAGYKTQKKGRVCRGAF